MKKIFFLSLIPGIIAGFFIGNISAVCPAIEIQESQGIVSSVTKSGEAYVVVVECECWHGVRKTSFLLHTPVKHQVGDLIRFE